MELETTIAAIATPLGEGGVAIIRLSGPEAFAIGKRVFSGPIEKYASHTAHYGKILNSQGEVVDDVLLLVMKGRRSYTGEDTVEIHCHGGSLITRRVLETVLQAGAQPARPGEFTYRAFLHGKLDLAQAEAVQTLISAKNEHALKAAELQLQGRLSLKIAEYQKELTDITAILEAWIDFPEEGLEFATLEEISTQLETIMIPMEKLLSTFHDGRMIHEGVTLSLVGAPNVGKSSLMNALLDKERAIVSAVPGTTRDVLEDHMRINGLHFKLLDTAGIREAEDLIEREGIRRSEKAIEEADLVLLVLDAHKGLQKEELQLMAKIPPHKTLAVWNKTDLPHAEPPALQFPHVRLSAREKRGLEDLYSSIEKILWEKGPPAKDEILITSVRHKEALEKALQACRQVHAGLQTGLSPEFLSLDMREALFQLGKIIGREITEDILTSIFSKFCIGK